MQRKINLHLHATGAMKFANRIKTDVQMCIFIALFSQSCATLISAPDKECFC